ncbi:E3 ubiquitin-protein ligase MGRN1-like [Argopecten irradians]|uniref:E3 ubiquitin-protein ligase MGRN1-like n=1 Tax=Argopecten irradians TaxID=31199 RepID=UPI0037125708
MGAFTSRNNDGVEEVDYATNNAYRYPPKMGNYFGTHFIMGGERFDMSQPEAYLFGENSDLNFLGSKPIPFPYPPPTGNEPTKTLKSLVNIRKDSLRFVRVEEADAAQLPDDGQTRKSSGCRYNIEFTFDCDVRCAITIYYFASEEITNGQLIYRPRDPSMNSETFHYKRGANQVFSQPTHIIDPNKYLDDEWLFDPVKETIPVVIHCVVEDDDHSNIDPDDDLEDSGAECVICMSDMRDTLILPCRHLCLCSTCAESLRYQASSCPICRSPFRALLQIRAMRKKQSVPLHQTEGNDENPVSQEGVPPGYEAVSLIEALNGPCNQFFPAPGDGFPVSMRMMQPGDMDSYHREKKRSSKRNVIAVDSAKDTQQNVVFLADDKKMLEEEERETADQPQVVMMTHSEQAKSPKKKDLNKPMYDESSDDMKTSKDDSQDRKDLQVYDLGESEADSDYELKPIQVKQTHLSAEDLADDEREDSSEAEPEPDPDYDNAINDETERSQDEESGDECAPPRASSQLEVGRVRDYEDRRVTYIKGLSRSANEVNTDSDGYTPLHVRNSLSLPVASSSSTEVSSFGSASSSQGLLPSDLVSDDDKLDL